MSTPRERIISAITDVVCRPRETVGAQTATPEQIADLVLQATASAAACGDRYQRDPDHECCCVMRPDHMAVIPRSGHGCRCGQIWGIAR